MAADPARGVLFVVATPIGNLEDITLRALRVLAEADLIACEDTRHTGNLLKAHGIRRPTVSYHEHNEDRRTLDLIERMRAGAKIALVSDAGTPAISDPGYRLVRAALDDGLRVAPIPGPSALTAAVSAAGLPTNRFAFEGFLPARPGARRKLLQELRAERRTMIFFESPRRLTEALAEMAACFGAEREATIMRELTKTFEEALCGRLGDLSGRVRAVRVRGEISIVVRGADAPDASAPARLNVEMLLEAGLSLKQASAVVAKVEGRSRREIYNENLK